MESNWRCALCRDAPYTVFVAARVGDGVDPTVEGNGRERSPFSLATAESPYFDYDTPVGCHIEPRESGTVTVYCDVDGGNNVEAFNVSGLANFKAGAGFVFAHYNHSYRALAYLQTFENGAPTGAKTASSTSGMRPHPVAIDVVSVGGRLGPRGTSFYYGSETSGGMWKGEVGELIVCTRQPTEAERAAILAYLRAKWFTGGDATTPAAIETVLAPSLDRNVAVTAAGGTELKSFAATQPLSSLAVTGAATFTRGGNATSAMFDVAGSLLLPAGMTLRMLFEPEETSSMDIITCSGTGSGTAWNIDARRPKNWSVVTTQNAIRALYTKPGMVIIIQ